MTQRKVELYCKCWACNGTRKTTIEFNKDRRGHLPIDSPCPLCEDGYCFYGVTGGQFEAIRDERDSFLAFAYAVSVNCSDPEVKSRAVELVKGKIGRALDYFHRKGLTVPT